MFRISHYMNGLQRSAPPKRIPINSGSAAPVAAPNSREAVAAAGRHPATTAPPVVIWNLTRRCNLLCRHCYATAADTPFRGELSESELLSVLDDLAQFGIKTVILSGGEPLLHPALNTLATRAKQYGMLVALSSNGTLITQAMSEQIAAIGYDYVGISLDGLPPRHDAFRRLEGAFDASLQALRWCRDAGLRVGMRFTLTEANAADLPALLQLMDDEGIEKFYLSHLNFGGRGNRHRDQHALPETTRRAMTLIFEHAWEAVQRGSARQFVSGNNDADAVWLLHWIRHHFPEREPQLQRRLATWGGNASGVGIANIDNLGIVHPDTFWWHHPLGSVRDRPFSTIWQDEGDPLLAALRRWPRPVTGRCGRCHYLAICGGNTRVRAAQQRGDPWAEDPGCYLADNEIGLTRTIRRVG